MKPYPQPVLLRLSDVSDVAANTAHRSAYVTTTLSAIVQGLRNLECQPDPFNEFQGPDALFSRLLAGLAGSAEYDAVLGNEVERLNALLAEQVLANDSLRRERDEARARLPALEAIASECANWIVQPYAGANSECYFCGHPPGVHDGGCISLRAKEALRTTPTPGAQP